MKYFVFDLGGVLSVPMNIRRLYDQINWKINFDEFVKKFNFSEEAIKAHKGEITTKDFFEYLKQYMNKDITLDEFEDMYINNDEFYQDTIDTINYLKKLKYKVCLLSNLKEIDYKKLKQNFDTSLFDEMFLSYKLHMMKPDDDIYQYVIDILKTKSEDLYFFDDNKENIDSAIRNGIHAYHVTGHQVKEKISKILESLRAIDEY